METSINNTFDLVNEIKLLGFNQGDRFLHFGSCDNGLNFLEQIKNNNMGIFYLGVDPSDKISEYVEKYSEEPTFAFQKRSMQEFIDNEFHKFEFTLITGIFDKPIFEEKQYIFISTILNECYKFSDKIIFTIDVEKYKKDYNFSILYVINNLINTYDKVNIKKISGTKYIISITS